MNKYHNWPDTLAKFPTQNGIPLFQTNILYLSIYWIWDLPEYFIGKLVISATQRYMELEIFQNTNVNPFVLHGLIYVETKRLKFLLMQDLWFKIIIIFIIPSTKLFYN